MGHSYHGSDNLAGEKRSGRHGFYRNVIRQGQTIFASLTNPRLQDRPLAHSPRFMSGLVLLSSVTSISVRRLL